MLIFAFQRLPSAPVFNGMKHTILLINRGDSLLVVSPSAVPSALLAVGLWVEDIVPFLPVMALVSSILSMQEVR